MITIKKNVLILFIILLVSCTKSKLELTKNYLTDDSEKYWIVVKDYPIKRYKGVSYNINGKYEEFTISDIGTRTKSMLYSNPKWELINDSTITDGNGDTLKIEYINTDVLILNNMTSKNKKILVLLKSPDQKTKPINDTTTYKDLIIL